VASHCKTKGWKVETEIRVRYQNGELFMPDLVVHKDDQNIVVADVHVSWLRADRVHDIYEAKRMKYGREKFLQAARKN
jgi:predicted nuclease of restriction endonuclease-like RecB superfamily